MRNTNIINHPNESNDFLANDFSTNEIYLTNMHNNSSQKFKKKCKTLVCYCMGLSLFTITSSLFFIVGYTYHDKLHCNNITSF